MNILDWFDIDNTEHLKAYRYLQEKGFWPDGFLPEDITYVSLYQVTLAQRFADRFIAEKLNESSIYYEDYSYYVGGEITCGRMPLKYMSWVGAGRPA